MQKNLTPKDIIGVYDSLVHRQLDENYNKALFMRTYIHGDGTIRNKIVVINRDTGEQRAYVKFSNILQALDYYNSIPTRKEIHRQ